MWCLSPFHSKVISIKSALAGSPVPFFLRLKLWASVLGKICPCWQICCSPPKKQKQKKTKERDKFPLLSKIQHLLTKHNQILQCTEVITPKQRAHETINIL